MKFKTLPCVVALLLVAPIFASEGAEGDFELGIYAGYSLMDDWGSGTSALNLEDDILFGLRGAWFFSPRFSLELSTQRLETRTAFDPSLMLTDRDTTIDSTRLNFLYNFRPDRRFRPFLTAGYGLASIDVSNLIDTDKAAFNAGGGIRWYVTPRFGMRLDARWVQTDVGNTFGPDPSDVEVTYGILWSLGGGGSSDTDGDGITDRKDRCPDTPRGADVDSRGCPSDGDNDGVFNGLDKCPDTPKGYKVDSSGCGIDHDGDGVPDSGDLCANTPKGARVDSTGCPSDDDSDGVFNGIDQCPDTPRGAIVNAEGCPTDSDGDGVFDGVDRCPETPAEAKVDLRGCPNDQDGDGVPDGIDQCPDTERGVSVNARGCEALFNPQAQQFVLEGVQFGFDSADLTPGSRAGLDRVARLMQQNPEVRVEVAGYTDSKGDDAYNLHLSQRRADAVRAYLLAAGVATPRIEARGYGEADPVADNATDAGRQQNRRVTLKQRN